MTLASQRFTSKEELANAVSHTIGAALSCVALVLMISFSAKNGTALHLASSVVFGSTMLLVYLSSSFNHWLPVSRTKEIFFTTDQIAIYLLIAGTYTPVSLIALTGVHGWIWFGIEWGLALIGIVLKLLKPVKFEKSVNLFIIISYLIMGWLVVTDIPSVMDRIGVDGLIWLLAGGFFYTFGILFFKAKQIKYHHLVWHFFVIAGSFCHFMTVYFYILPLPVS
jgi:hemolysin III